MFRRVLSTLATLGAAVGAGCGSGAPPAGPPEEAPRGSRVAADPEAAAAVARLLRTFGMRLPERPDQGDAGLGERIPAPRTRPVLDAPAARGFERDGARLQPRFDGPVSADVALPDHASGAFRVRDVRSALAVDVRLREATDAPAAVVDGYVVYVGATADGAHVLHRASTTGTEDYHYFASPPEVEEATYDLALGAGVAGLRLVASTLELLDEAGAPRLRVAPPFVVDRDGRRHTARLSVEGCAVDRDPAAPWGRAVTEPGSTTCALRISWSGSDVGYPAVLDPSWTTTVNMIEARSEHVAAVLLDGTVLVAGGIAASYLASAEVYDPTFGTWTATGGMASARTHFYGATLASGEVLVMGGFNVSEGRLASAELFAGGAWTPTGSLATKRNQFAGALLQDGRVLVAGGKDGPAMFDIVETAEVYDAGAWSSAGTLAKPRYDANLPAAVLADGRVLLVGGLGDVGGVIDQLVDAEIYDPAAPAGSEWSPTASMATERVGHTATTLGDGRVLVVGGGSGFGPISSVEIFDGVGAWNPGPSLAQPRGRQTATVLQTGAVLVAGGFTTGSVAVLVSEIFDPATDTWCETASLNQGRLIDHTASLLTDGRVLVAGGFNGGALASAEIFDLGVGNCNAEHGQALGDCGAAQGACNGGCPAMCPPPAPGCVPACIADCQAAHDDCVAAADAALGACLSGCL